MSPISARSHPVVVLATGGTAGHVFPAEALAAELGERGCRLVLITDRRGGAVGVRLGELETHKVRAGGIAGKGVSARILSVGEILVGIIQAYRLLRRIDPDVVVGFGGYASVPTMLAASWARIRSVMHEQNAVLGRANRLLAARVQRIATSFERMSALPANAAEVVFTGMPVRPAVLVQRDTPYPSRGPESDIRLLVFGGSLGATVFARIVPEAVGRVAPKLSARIRVTQQCRPEDVETVTDAYRNLGIDAEVAAFFGDLPERIALSHLVISRAGASTIAELTTIGRPAVIVPYPHAIDDHQTSNAHAVDGAGGGWLLPEPAFTVEALAERLESLLTMPRILETAAAAARASARPDAAARLADLVLGQLNGNGESQARKEAA